MLYLHTIHRQFFSETYPYISLIFVNISILEQNVFSAFKSPLTPSRYSSLSESNVILHVLKMIEHGHLRKPRELSSLLVPYAEGTKWT